MGRIHLSTFRVLMHESEHAVDIVKLMDDIDAYRTCINADSLEYIQCTTQPFTMDFQRDDMHVRIITNDKGAFIVEKNGERFEPDRASESTEDFLRRVLAISEAILVDDMLFSGQVLTSTFYDEWTKAMVHSLKAEHLLDGATLLYNEILLPLRSMSDDEQAAVLLEPIAQKHGLDVVTFDVETL